MKMKRIIVYGQVSIGPILINKFPIDMIRSSPDIFVLYFQYLFVEEIVSE